MINELITLFISKYFSKKTSFKLFIINNKYNKLDNILKLQKRMQRVINKNENNLLYNKNLSSRIIFTAGIKFIMRRTLIDFDIVHVMQMHDFS